MGRAWRATTKTIKRSLPQPYKDARFSPWDGIAALFIPTMISIFGDLFDYFGLPRFGLAKFLGLVVGASLAILFARMVKPSQQR